MNLFEKRKWKGWTLPALWEWLILLVLILAAAARCAFGQDTTLWQHSVVGTNWQSMTNYVECHIGDTNGQQIIFFPRDTFLLGTVYSNNLATIMHQNKPLSTTLVSSNVLYSLKVTFTTNVVAHTNVMK